MDAINKLVRKLTPKDRVVLISFIEDVLEPARHEHLNIKKLAGGSGYYRAKKGKLRIVFHFDPKGEVIVDAVRIRNEKTYKDF